MRARSASWEPEYQPPRLLCEPTVGGKAWSRALVNAAQKCFDIWQPAERLKSIPIKGLHGQMMPFQEYVALMKQEARSEYQHYLRTHPRLTQGRLWA